MEYKTTEGERKSSRKWDKQNPEKKNYMNKKSTTKNFITKTALPEDIELVADWLEERTGQSIGTVATITPESLNTYIDQLTETELTELISTLSTKLSNISK